MQSDAQEDFTKGPDMRKVVITMLATMLFSAVITIPAGANGVSCGDEVYEDLVLTHDLTGCEEDGLTVKASDIVVDLNGFMISGDGQGLGGGVRIEGDFERVHVRNGTLTGFNEGVVLAGGANHNLISDLIVFDNNRGIDLAGGNTNNLIEKNQAHDNLWDGIRVDASSSNVVHKNLVENNGFGISVSNGAHNNTITKNILRGNNHGITLFTNADDNTLQKNEISETVFIAGIYIHSGSDRTLVAKNVSSHNTASGIIIGAPPLQGRPTGTRLIGNIASYNGGDGIQIITDNAIVTRNVAHNNADNGIDALAGVTDGGRNIATGNLAEGEMPPPQCVNIACAAS